MKLHVKKNRFLFHGVDGKTELTLTGDQKFLVEVGMFSLLISNFQKSKITAVEGTHSIVIVMSEAKAFWHDTPEHRRTNWLKYYAYCVQDFGRSVQQIISEPPDSRILVVKKLDHHSNGFFHGGRRLVDSAVNVGNATGTGYTAAQVEDYQVYLWSFLLLGFMLYLAVNSLMFMDISEDPQLYATYLLKRPKQD